MRLGEARAAMAGMVTGDFLDPARFTAFLEAHIEQGPVLDEAGEAAGIVTGIVGIRDMTLTFTGQQNHAGTTPMARRRDAFQGLAAFATALEARLAPIVTAASVWTIGHVEVMPGAASIVPGRVRFSMQWRDGDAARLEAMEAAIRETAAGTARARGLQMEAGEVIALAPTAMAPGPVRALEEAARQVVPGRWRRIESGALHDAANMAALMPAGMLFIPSKGGISHSFDEDTDEADLVAGLAVLGEATGALG